MKCDELLGTSHPGNVPQANLAKLRYYHNLFMWLTWSELQTTKNNYMGLSAVYRFRISFHCLNYWINTTSRVNKSPVVHGGCIHCNRFLPFWIERSVSKFSIYVYLFILVLCTVYAVHSTLFHNNNFKPLKLIKEVIIHAFSKSSGE